MSTAPSGQSSGGGVRSDAERSAGHRVEWCPWTGTNAGRRRASAYQPAACSVGSWRKPRRHLWLVVRLGRQHRRQSVDRRAEAGTVHVAPVCRSYLGERGSASRFSLRRPRVHARPRRAADGHGRSLHSAERDIGTTARSPWVPSSPLSVRFPVRRVSAEFRGAAASNYVPMVELTGSTPEPKRLRDDLTRMSGTDRREMRQVMPSPGLLFRSTTRFSTICVTDPCQPPRSSAADGDRP